MERKPLPQKLKIVLSGSGMRYPAHVGFLEAIVDEGYEIERICGVSGGSIVASALASGFRPEDGSLRDIILNSLPGSNNLIDYTWWPFKGYGFISGDKIENFLDKKMPHCLSDLEVPVDIVAVDLEARDYTIFNKENFPNLRISEAIRASMSIPFVFKYKEIEERIYVDGGVASNFPLDIYGVKSNVLGCRVFNKSTSSKITGLRKYVHAVIDTMLEAAVREHVEDVIFERTVRVHSNASGLEFNLTKKKANQLIESSYSQTKNNLKKWNKIGGLLCKE